MTSLLDKIERVPVDSLELFPGNARKGDIDAIAESLAENGQVSPIVVQRSTRYVLGGNHTLQAARRLGWPHIDAVFVDVDDDRALRINVALNRTTDRSVYDNDALYAQLASLDDLSGTGFTDSDFTDLAQITGMLSDEATAFLNPFTGPPPAGPAGHQPAHQPGTGGGPQPQPERTTPEWVPVTWTLAPADRDTVRKATELARKNENLQTSAEGLLALAIYYLTRHPE